MCACGSHTATVAECVKEHTVHGWACKFEREREKEKGMSEAGGGGVGVIMGSVMLQWGKKKKKKVTTGKKFGV